MAKEAVVTKRTRRDTHVVRSLILNAARRVFAERGYRASMRDIAEVAGVNEVLLYRHFESKALLFEAAVAGPIDDFYRVFEAAEGLGPSDIKSIDERNHAFVQSMYDILEENREIIFSFLSSIEFETELRSLQDFHQLDSYFETATESLSRRYKAMNEQPLIPPQLAARFGFATIAAVILFRKWIFGDTKLKRIEMIDALHKFTMHGLTPPGAVKGEEKKALAPQKSAPRVASKKPSPRRTKR